MVAPLSSPTAYEPGEAEGSVRVTVPEAVEVASVTIGGFSPERLCSLMSAGLSSDWHELLRRHWAVT